MSPSGRGEERREGEEAAAVFLISISMYLFFSVFHLQPPLFPQTRECGIARLAFS